MGDGCGAVRRRGIDDDAGVSREEQRKETQSEDG
jgi:hypothetical protein